MVEDINAEWNSDLPHSFGGKYLSYAHYSDRSKKNIDQAFAKNDIYSRFLPYKKPREYNPVYVYRKRQLFQADTVKFTNSHMKKATGKTNLLVIIDAFTKMIWLKPLKNATKEVVGDYLNELFTMIEPPEQFQTDAGKEFVNQTVKDVLGRHNVEHLVARGQVKACIAERVNLTIQRIIYQRCAKLNTNDWASDRVLEVARKIYLNRKHKTIKMTPLEAELPENQQELRETFYKRYIEAESKRKKPRYKVGDTVRISNTRVSFQRGYHTNFTEEVWKVARVLSNEPQPRYIVEDLNGEELNCVLNENELVAYQPDDDQLYVVDEILRERTRKGKKEYFVSWRNYPPKFNSWIPAENMQDVQQG